MTSTATRSSFEDRLLDVLLHEHATIQLAALAPAADRRAGHRRVQIASIGVAAAVTAVAVAVVGLDTGSRPALDDTAAVRQETRGLDVENAALIVNKTNDAIAQADGTILHAEYSGVVGAGGAGAPSRTDLWFDQADPANIRVLYRTDDGQPWIDEGFVREGDLIHTREVDHERGVVTETRAPADELRGEAPPALDVDPQRITAEVSAGALTMVGEERLGDATVVHLRGVDPTGTRDLWVDASTYLPVRATASGSFGAYEIDYHWEPRTDAAVRDLLPAVPDGYEVTSDAP